MSAIPPRLRKIGKTAGKVAIGLIVLDLVVGAAAVAFGAEWLRR
jgi:hypothetical protein